MELLIIKGDETTPNIKFNPKTGIFTMGGVAIPEDVREMTEPIINWVKKYIEKPQKATELTFNFEYLNTAATKMVFQICAVLDDLHGIDGCRVKFIWKYVRGDAEMHELGEEILDSFDSMTEIEVVDEIV